jgi:hypothetical protein
MDHDVWAEWMLAKPQMSSDKLNSFTSLIRFWVHSESDLTDSDKRRFACSLYGQLPLMKGTLATAVLCPSALKSGP